MLNLRDPETGQYIVYSRTNYSLPNTTRFVVNDPGKRASPTASKDASATP
ncbi:hypothetical protein [Paludisphaera soli]|nr:hypothetical protein [Paludisphaera soli]